MNRSARWFVVGLLFLSLWSLPSCSKHSRSGRDVNTDHLAEIPAPDFPIVVNDKVVAWIEYFQGRGKGHFERYLKRSAKYTPMISRVLRRNGLPDDLVYLAMIESGFNPHAYSRAHAVGTWQFIYSTGKRYGLRADEWVDERRDPEKATVAAAKYLKDLYDRFNDWYLAAAGYNAGEGKIERAKKRYRTVDFWKMSKGRYLRRETKEYVPKIIAAAIIAKNPKKYGFRNIEYEDVISYEEVSVKHPTDLRVIAECVGSSYENIKALNPELLHWITPPEYKNYALKVPEGTAGKYKKTCGGLSKEERLAREIHPVEKKEPVGDIALRYHVDPFFFAVINGYKDPYQKAGSGEKLLVPRGAPDGEKFDRPHYKGYRYASGKKYRIRHGDTLGRIARNFGTTVSQLKKMNPGINPRRLRPGKSIRVGGKDSYVASRRSYKPSSHAAAHEGRETRGRRSPDKKGQYTIRSGDTLGHIATDLGISVAQLTKLNPGINPRRLHPGQRLRVTGAKDQRQVEVTETVVVAEQKTEKKIQLAAMVPGVEAITEASKPRFHKIRSGDTLYAIAQQYGVTANQLKRWNGIKNHRLIKAGKKIRVVP